MKAEFYFTLLDGLLAKTIYHPQNPGTLKRAPFFWSVSLCQVSREPADAISTTVTWIPCHEKCVYDEQQEQGMRTSATPLCAYRLSLHG